MPARLTPTYSTRHNLLRPERSPGGRLCFAHAGATRRRTTSAIGDNASRCYRCRDRRWHAVCRVVPEERCAPHRTRALSVDLRTTDIAADRPDRLSSHTWSEDQRTEDHAPDILHRR